MNRAERRAQRRLGETMEHANKRAFKGIVGSRPASKVERQARRIGAEQLRRMDQGGGK